MTSNNIDRPLYSLDDDDKPLYSIEDDLGTASGDNKAADVNSDNTLYDEEVEDDEEEDGEDDEEEVNDAETAAPTRSGPSPMRIMLKTMLTPVEGWKALKRARFSTDDFAARCFYPLVGFAALAEAAAMIYEANVGLADWAVDGVVAFVTFFFGYFTAILAGGILLPRKSRDLLSKNIGRQMVMLSMATLTIFWALIQLVPMFEPVLVFLPIWTIYLIYKGVRVLRVPDDVASSTTGIICMLVIGAPLMWYWILTEVLFPLTTQ